MEAEAPLFPCFVLPWRWARLFTRLLFALCLCGSCFGTILACAWLAAATSSSTYTAWAPEASLANFLLLIVTTLLAVPPALWLLPKATTPFLHGVALLAVGNWAAQVNYLAALLPMTGNPFSLDFLLIGPGAVMCAGLLFGVPCFAAVLMLWRLSTQEMHRPPKTAWCLLLAAPPLGMPAIWLYLKHPEMPAFKGLVAVMVATALVEVALIAHGYVRAMGTAKIGEVTGREARKMRLELTSFAAVLFFCLLQFFCVLELKGVLDVVYPYSVGFTVLHRFSTLGDVLAKATLALALSGALGGKEGLQAMQEASPPWIFGPDGKPAPRENLDGVAVLGSSGRLYL